MQTEVKQKEHDNRAIEASYEMAKQENEELKEKNEILKIKIEGLENEN